jgi:GR25 family glycosyltransferase involved in LPS biosynthesis
MLDWGFLDRVYVLTIHEHEHRHPRLRSFLRDMNIHDAEWSVRHRDPDGKKGCFEHHRDVMRRAHDAGYEKVMILEDDAMPTDALTPESVDALRRFTADDHWDIIFLGHCSGDPNRKKPTRYPTIWEMRTQCMHAYVVHRRFMRRCLDMVYDGKYQIDEVFYRNRDVPIHVVIPMMFSQDLRYASSVQTGANRFHIFGKTGLVIHNYRRPLLIAGMVVLCVVVALVVVVLVVVFR